MNDPHVVRILYRIRHSDSIDYDNAKPLDHKERDFAIRIEDNDANIEMLTHFATEKDALAVVEPFLRTWELHNELNRGHDNLQFVFMSSIVIDRKPTRPVIELQSISSLTFVGSATLHTRANHYPPPPSNLAWNDEIGSLLSRFKQYQSGLAQLPEVAYYCADFIKHVGSKNLGISNTVVTTIRRLSSEKGGDSARKVRGTENDLTAEEVKWLEEVMKAVILRASQIEYDADANAPEITKADFPTL